MDGENSEEQRQQPTNINLDYLLSEGFYVGLAGCLNCSKKWVTVLPPEAKKVCRNVECPDCGNKNNTFRHITSKNKARVLKGFET